jgi:hypothetical protein
MLPNLFAGLCTNYSGMVSIFRVNLLKLKQTKDVRGGVAASIGRFASKSNPMDQALWGCPLDKELHYNKAICVIVTAQRGLQT